MLKDDASNISSDTTAPAAVADEVDNDDDTDGRNVLCRSNATLRDKSTVRTDNRMALAGCWKVYFMYFFLLSLATLADEDEVIVTLLLLLLVVVEVGGGGGGGAIVVRDLFAEVDDEMEKYPVFDIMSGGATCRMVIAANVGSDDDDDGAP